MNELERMRDKHLAWIKAFGRTEYLSSSDVLDIGQRQAILDREAALARVLQGQIDHACRALQRVREGADGRCEDCGGTIPEERLEILPEATRCVSCQEGWEQLAQCHKTNLKLSADRLSDKADERSVVQN
ncbi:MAG: TraR/DksA family transcriptional regulator [Candidatus Bathyarchaeota archaeon]|nr:TraR/DksA family transcriptional regulator [Candidatus Bathyarchaeota archaeon]